MVFEVVDPRSLQGRRGAGAGTDGPRPVKAPMPGRVVRLLVEVGEDVEEGQGCVVIEAMKMQNELKSPGAGRVVRVGVEGWGHGWIGGPCLWWWSRGYSPSPVLPAWKSPVFSGLRGVMSCKIFITNGLRPKYCI